MSEEKNQNEEIEIEVVEDVDGNVEVVSEDVELSEEELEGVSGGGFKAIVDLNDAGNSW